MVVLERARYAGMIARRFRFGGNLNLEHPGSPFAATTDPALSSYPYLNCTVPVNAPAFCKPPRLSV